MNTLYGKYLPNVYHIVIISAFLISNKELWKYTCKKIIHSFITFFSNNTSGRDIAITFLKVQENKRSFGNGPSHLCAPGKDQALVTMAYDAYLNEISQEELN